MAGKRVREATIVRSGFAVLVTEVKGRIQAAQTRAMLAVNAELVRLYRDIGRIIDERQQREGWPSIGNTVGWLRVHRRPRHKSPLPQK